MLLVTLCKMLVCLRNALFSLVLNFFAGLNKKIDSRLPFWRLENETAEHVDSIVKVFEFLIFPSTLLYFFIHFYFFKENAFDTIFWSIAAFLYSNFLPDLPSIQRKKGKRLTGDLPWHKKYSILLFAPLFVWLLFSGIRLGWDTTESFHNFRSLTIYGAFLFLLSFFAFGNSLLLMGDVTKILLPTCYGVIGYLTHLKADEIW